MFKVNYKSNRKRCQICSKLTIKTPERRQWRHSGVFVVSIKHISHFEQVNVSWELFSYLFRYSCLFYSTSMSNFKNIKIYKFWHNLYSLFVIGCGKWMLTIRKVALSFIFSLFSDIVCHEFLKKSDSKEKLASPFSIPHIPMLKYIF